MQEILLMLSVAAVFVFGLFVMKRLDAALAARNAAPEQKSALRIAFSEPTAAGAVSQSLEQLCRAYPELGVYLYTADAESILAQLYDGQLDVAILPCLAASKKRSGYNTVNILIEPRAVMATDAALPLRPLETSGVLQQLIWAKGACHGAADAFAAQAAHDLQQRAGNMRFEQV